MENILFDNPEEFFKVVGISEVMLTRRASQAVCGAATSRHLLINRIEGGISRPTGIEARIDCIWDGLDPPVTIAEAEINNQLAIDFIQLTDIICDAFIVTATPLTGWWKRPQ